MWDLIEATSSQFRMAATGPIGLDYGAIVAFSALGGGLSPFESLLLGEVLPTCEAHLLAGLRDREVD